MQEQVKKSWYFCQPFWKFTQSARKNTITIIRLSVGLLPLLRPSKKWLTASDELKKLSRQKFYWRGGGFGAFVVSPMLLFWLKLEQKRKHCIYTLFL